MRNVKTICICLPADMAERLRENAQRCGLSISSYVKMMLLTADTFRHGKTHADHGASMAKLQLSSMYGTVCSADTDSVEVMDDGSENY